MVLIYLLLASNLWLFLHSFKQVQKEIHDAGFYIDADLTDRKIDKKVPISVHVPSFVLWLAGDS